MNTTLTIQSLARDAARKIHPYYGHIANGTVERTAAFIAETFASLAGLENTILEQRAYIDETNAIRVQLTALQSALQEAGKDKERIEKALGAALQTAAIHGASAVELNVIHEIAYPTKGDHNDTAGN